MPRILVTGSRDWSDYDVMADALRHHVAGDNPKPVLVHGGCRGADLMADELWTALDLPTEVHPARWAEHGKRAGYVRNQRMVDLGADVCLAFLLPQSRGARMCADLAERAGIRVVRIEGQA